MKREITDHRELRMAVYHNMLENELGYAALAKRIGIHHHTLRAFLDATKEATFPTLAKIIKYLRSEGSNIEIFHSETNIEA